MRVTCDANFLVRAALHPRGLAAAILDLTLQPEHILVLSPLILNHVRRALRHAHIQRRYGIPDQDIDAYVQFLDSVSDLVLAPAVVPVVLSDPDDDEVIATAVDGKAHVICTLDHHFDDASVRAYCSARGIRILTDLQLVQELRGETA